MDTHEGEYDKCMHAGTLVPWTSDVEIEWHAGVATTQESILPILYRHHTSCKALPGEQPMWCFNAPQTLHGYIEICGIKAHVLFDFGCTCHENDLAPIIFIPKNLIIFQHSNLTAQHLQRTTTEQRYILYSTTRAQTNYQNERMTTLQRGTAVHYPRRPIRREVDEPLSIDTRRRDRTLSIIVYLEGIPPRTRDTPQTLRRQNVAETNQCRHTRT